jgi:hypothetical protein
VQTAELRKIIGKNAEFFSACAGRLKIKQLLLKDILSEIAAQ